VRAVVPLVEVAVALRAHRSGPDDVDAARHLA
jgi:hypothetical protein